MAMSTSSVLVPRWIDWLYLGDPRMNFGFPTPSLPCCRHARFRCGVSYPQYIPEILSLVKGIRKCCQHLETTSEPVELVYFDNYRWDGRQGVRIEKPFPKRDFRTFEGYEDFLRTSLERLSKNLHDSRRTHPFSLITTISSGYDSPTIAALARDYGCGTAITFAQARDGTEDSGVEIGRRLGLVTKSVESNTWQQLPPCEAPFYGAAGFMGEIVYTGHADSLRGAVVLTGYHGDGIWGLRSRYEGSDIVRGDCSGLALSEYRLSQGFVHCPVPFFGARQIDDIHAIACQPEMNPWSLPGTAYNRPICRRIVESAGIPRDLFGVEKKAVGLSRFYLSDASRASYMRFLREHQQEWVVKGRLPPIRSKSFDYSVDMAHRSAYGSCLALVRLKRRMQEARASTASTNNQMPTILRHEPKRTFTKRVQEFLFQPRNLHRYVVPWAIEECKRRYATQERWQSIMRSDSQLMWIGGRQSRS